MIILRATILALACTVLVALAEAGDKVYTIDDAYRAALAGNENVKIAEEDVIQSESRVDQAWTYLYPQLVAQGAYTRFNETLPPGGGPFLFQPKEQYQASLVLTQPLYTGGRTLAALRTAQKMREASSSGLSLTRQDMMLSVAEAYYGVLKAQKSVDISKRSLERMEHHKETTEREAATRKSKANQSALLRANSLVSQARIALVRAQDGLKIAHEKLSLLTKLPKDIQVAEPEQLEQSSESLEIFRRPLSANVPITRLPGSTKTSRTKTLRSCRADTIHNSPLWPAPSTRNLNLPSLQMPRLTTPVCGSLCRFLRAD